jgi:membrane protease subunit HflK
MALNDPNWGRRGEGPPDLDEIWNRFRQKITGALGGKGGGPREPGLGTGRRLPGGAGLLVVLIIVIWLASGFYIVDASQRGVVLRFGKYAQTTEPGPQWHLPYPIEGVEIVNLSQVRTLEVGYRNNVKNKVLKESLMLTDDENIVDLQFAVQYMLKDPTEYLFYNRNPDDSVMQVAESAMREIVGKSRMDFVLYEGREQIRAQAQKLMQEILDRYKTGVAISQVTMQQAQPPEQVQAAFDDAVKAGQDRERQINEGQAYSNDVVPKARGTASRLLQEAEGYKQRVIANAEGEAARFNQILTEYSRAPAVTRQRMYLDAIQQILSSTTKVIIDQKAGSNLLFLPFDKLLQMSGAAAGASASSGPENAPEHNVVPEIQSTTPAAPALDNRSRDSFRGRDREARP